VVQWRNKKGRHLTASNGPLSSSTQMEQGTLQHKQQRSGNRLLVSQSISQ
jgi:hypothetical protein